MKGFVTILSVLVLFFLLSSFGHLQAQQIWMDVGNTSQIFHPTGPPLQAGAIVHVIWVGPNGQIDDPIAHLGQADNGLPGGDDVLIQPTHVIGEGWGGTAGFFFFQVNTYPDHNSGYPAAGDLVYIRVFDSNDLVNAIFYGESQLYQITYIQGEYFDPAIGGLAQALPVELISFAAYAGNQSVLLKWKTASETSNMGFKIMRSPAEQGEYSEVGSYLHNEALKGAGNSSKEHHYSFQDVHLANGTTYWYKLISVDFNGETFEYDPVSATPNVGFLNQMNLGEIPKHFQLHQNYPNPFNPDTRIEFGIPQTDFVGRTRLLIFNILGQKVKTLVDKELQPGFYYLNWDGTNDAGKRMGSGIYIYYLESGYYHSVQKLMLVK